MRPIRLHGLNNCNFPFFILSRISSNAFSFVGFIYADTLFLTLTPRLVSPSQLLRITLTWTLVPLSPLEFPRPCELHIFYTHSEECAQSACMDDRQVSCAIARLVPVASLLNEHYVRRVTPLASQEMVDAHGVIHRGDHATPCYITAPAVAWVVAGRDVAPPFSGAWLGVNVRQGPGEGGVRLVAGWDEPLEDGDDFAHVALAVGDMVFDSMWRQRRLGFRRMCAAEWDEYPEVRHIPLAAGPCVSTTVENLLAELKRTSRL